MKFTQEMIDSFKTNQHIMLDIEALGQNPGGVVTSIGLVQFVPLTGQLGAETKINIGVQSSLNAGMDVTGSTIEWWFDQSKEAQKAMLESPIPLADMPGAINEFTNSVGKHGEIWWWANGGNFDFVNLAAAIRAAGKDWMPWRWNRLIDYASLRRFSGYRPPKEWFEEDTLNHDAVSDCYRQIKGVQQFLTEWCGLEQ